MAVKPGSAERTPEDELHSWLGLLEGTGKRVRFVRLEAASRLSDPDLKALIDAAVERAAASSPPAPHGRPGRLILRPSSAKSPSRRKPSG